MHPISLLLQLTRFKPREAVPWIKYMPIDALLASFEHILTSLGELQGSASIAPDESWLHILGEISCCLMRSNESTTFKRLIGHLPKLLSLSGSLAKTDALDKLMAHAVDASISLGCGGTVTTSEYLSFESLIRAAEVRWAGRSERLPEDSSISALLRRPEWTRSTSRALACFIYRSAHARDEFRKWLELTPPSARPTADLLMPALLAFLETGDDQLDDKEAKWAISSICAIFFIEAEGEAAQNQAACLRALVSRHVEARGVYLHCLQNHVSALSPDRLHVESLRLCQAISRLCKHDADALQASATEYALQWCLRHLSESDEHPNDLLLDEVCEYSHEV